MFPFALGFFNCRWGFSSSAMIGNGLMDKDNIVLSVPFLLKFT